MRALIHHGPPGLAGVQVAEVPDPIAGPGEVKVQLKYAGLNHRDLLQVEKRTPTDPSVVLGSDGMGLIAAVGEGVTGFSVGDEVIINPSLGWLQKSDAPPKEFQILGIPRDGTFAQAIVVPAANVAPKPSYLSDEEAGVLALAALTAYRALFTRGNLQAGQTVVIPGAGGGAATFLLMMAKAAGAKVVVTSRHAAKRAKSLELGADLALDSAADWQQELGGQIADLVIESVGPATFAKSLSVLRPGGTVVTFGATTGDEVSFNLRSFFYGQFNLKGTTMGSAEELREMLAFIERHQLHPVMDEVFLLTEGRKALARMDEGEQLGKIALRMEA
ncbi:zinc-binding dehydrogenase [Alicyclobacillus tolerans]|uniref:zinc-binding dehydrogenase n=1 Tax=Alicyclobacillus tolerans TaxID=90970 RepID=UPI001F1B0ADE|nr:zinc-binding dehydrogenase [Alicyclobacillus tolerans]MCF8567095.1 zinc-binding dehydrogenase [Alicyclobacillus tolerans]